MTLTKEKNNTHKQRRLPDDERPVEGSYGHETHFRRISTDAKQCHSFFMRWPMRHSCDRAFITTSLKYSGFTHRDYKKLSKIMFSSRQNFKDSYKNVINIILIQNNIVSLLWSLQSCKPKQKQTERHCRPKQ